MRPDVDEAHLAEVLHTRVKAAFAVGFRSEQKWLYGVAVDYYQNALNLDPNYEKAQYHLGMLYLRGHGVSIDLKQAQELLLKAAAKGYAPAITQLGNLALERKDMPGAMQLFKKAIEANDGGEAHFKLGQCLTNFMVANFLPGLSEFVIAARRGYKPAYDYLEQCWKYSRGAAACQLACAFGRLSEQQGHYQGRYHAILWYKKVLNMMKDSGESAADAASFAFIGLKILAESSPDACYLLGEVYKDGLGVPKDDEAALKSYVRAIEQIDYQALDKIKEYAVSNNDIAVQAQMVLAALYNRGCGVVEKSPEEYTTWLTKAAEKGSALAMFLLGSRFVLSAPSKAADWCIRALKRSLNPDPHAQKIAESYNDALGLGQNERRIMDVEKVRTAASQLLFELADHSEDVQYRIGQMHENGEVFPANKEEAFSWYKRAAEGKHTQALCALGRLCENRPLKSFKKASDILKSYEEALVWYNTAAANSIEADDHKERIIEALKNLRSIKEPEFRNYLLEKLKLNLSDDVAADLFYWFAYITNIVSLRCSPNIHEPICMALIGISKFPNLNRQARAIVKVLSQLIENEGFSDLPFSDQAEALRINHLGRICRGVKVLSTPHKVFVLNIPEKIKRAADFINDMRIAVFNCLFHAAEKTCDKKVYQAAVGQILKFFDEGIEKKLITEEMCWDDEFDLVGTRNKLEKLITYHDTARFKSRIVRIAEILSKKPEEDRAPILGTWAGAGHHCSTRAEQETYKFYVEHVTDAKSLDNDKASLGMRVALCLAELRKSLLDKLVPDDESERIHQIAHLQKKVGTLLALVGDAEGFSDHYEETVVIEQYKKMTPDQIQTLVLDMYSEESMINCIVDEANKRVSRIPYNIISEYFEMLPGGLGLLSHLYDENGLLTKEGAKLLLYHFEYLE